MNPTAPWNPPPSAESLAPSWVLLPWHLVAAGCLLVAAALGLAVFRKLRKHRRTAAKADPRTAALDAALAALDALPEPAPPAEVSSIVRSFLFSGLDDPALFETQEEFNARDKALAAVPESQRAGLAGFLNRLAELKYAPDAADPTALRQLAPEARALLLPLKSTPKA
jgi:hypothetical protein